MERGAEISRKTKETDVSIKLNIDGQGAARLDYPIGFMAHMLNTFARHGLFDLEIAALGDLEVDQHHLVEDTGIVLGQCFARALGEKRGIRRGGSCLFPMDETLARAVVDISGRPFLFFDAQLSGAPLLASNNGDEKSFQFQTDTVEDFWQGFTGALGCNLHLEILRGRSDHHKIEALFKAASRAFRAACEIDERARDLIPSAKGNLNTLTIA
ncbi:MAG: imidazoleglycerol-phosphate dehydratase [Treponema sp.]|jgi:imidazoleglycerol-phosphate dehydratase|nr:imidazoleglycerol-phosphate dehydratase [Treponema sp.]